MYYRNRKDAADRLIPYLAGYKNDKGVVLAVPRGGVPLGYQIAMHYRFPLELLMTKKIGHPANPEYAIGAVSLEDQVVDKDINVPASYIEREVASIRRNLAQRYAFFMGDHKPIPLKGKTVIVVDDGIATGKTIMSAITMLRKQEPAKIVVAVPVAPPETAKTIAKVVDDFICPYLPEDFYGVGYHYSDFSQVSDEEVISYLRAARNFDQAA